jgi:hypothetical protein
MRNAKWLRLLAYVTGSVNQELLARNEYLAAENRILRAKLPSQLRLSDPERGTLAEIGNRLGRKALREVASVAKPDTILAWFRRLVTQVQRPQAPAVPRPSSSFSRSRSLGVRIARENSGWGIRPHRWCPGQPGPSRFRSNGREYTPSPRYRSGSQEKPNHDLEGLPSRSYECVGWSEERRHQTSAKRQPDRAYLLYLQANPARFLQTSCTMVIQRSNADEPQSAGVSASQIGNIARFLLISRFC